MARKMAPGQLLCVWILLSFVYKTSSICSKTPEGIVKPKNRNVGDKFMLEIPGNPKTYIPSQRYNISLKTHPRAYPQKAFKNFIITLESDDSENEDHDVGELGFDEDTEMLARFSSTCPNTIVESSTVLKTDIHVHWIAPNAGNGCVNIKATVVESKGNWYSEDDTLTKNLCEETLQNENVQPETLTECCACDEAKYELAFDGKWTRNTHPRHFPIDHWNTKFSDLIGASHQLDHAFWNYEESASAGLKELAETGDTKTLESELKNNSEYIRTIIKARGLHYPNITKSTYAVFRVDKKNHLVSLVTKITPSPDWVVGVSNLELCREDCTWEKTRILNLYAWDVGTNDGLGYKSSEPTHTIQPIRRITPNNPNDTRSPFYSEDGEEMKPIAKLRLTRQRLYTKTCEEETEDEIDCSRTDWLEWTPCSVTCGTGVKVRQRAHMNQVQATQCKVNLVDIENCVEQECDEAEDEVENNTDKAIDESIDDTPICTDGGPNCEDPTCPGTFMAPWTDCSATCGKGTKKRIRMKIAGSDNEDLDCTKSEEVECEVAKCNDEGSEIPKYAGDMESSNIVAQEPVGEVVDCSVSNWSRWSRCISQHGECGKGSKYKFRKILVHESNGGKVCPKDLLKTKNCDVPCSGKTECIMTPWSNWTPCTSNCGATAVQIRTRRIEYKPPGLASCPPRKERRSCLLPLACTEDGEPILNG